MLQVKFDTLKTHLMYVLITHMSEIRATNLWTDDIQNKD
jgi:hypothetical protein